MSCVICPNGCGRTFKTIKKPFVNHIRKTCPKISGCVCCGEKHTFKERRAHLEKRREKKPKQNKEKPNINKNLENQKHKNNKNQNDKKGTTDARKHGHRNPNASLKRKYDTVKAYRKWLKENDFLDTSDSVKKYEKEVSLKPRTLLRYKKDAVKVEINLTAKILIKQMDSPHGREMAAEIMSFSHDFTKGEVKKSMELNIKSRSPGSGVRPGDQLKIPTDLHNQLLLIVAHYRGLPTDNHKLSEHHFYYYQENEQMKSTSKENAELNGLLYHKLDNGEALYLPLTLRDLVHHIRDECPEKYDNQWNQTRQCFNEFENSFHFL